MPVIGALDVALATKRTGDATVDPEAGEETVTEPAKPTVLSINTTLTNLHAKNVPKSASVLFFINFRLLTKNMRRYKLSNLEVVIRRYAVGQRVFRNARSR